MATDLLHSVDKQEAALSRLPQPQENLLGGLISRNGDTLPPLAPHTPLYQPLSLTVIPLAANQEADYHLSVSGWIQG